MRVKLVLPALTEATSPYWRPIKYSLFPPLGLVCMLLPGWGLLFFAVGFGLGHIGYGLLMYNRYERPGAAGASAQPAVSSS